MPVAIPEIDREVRPLRLQFLVQRRNQLSVLSIYWANSAKQFVVLRNSEQALARHISPPQHIFQKWHDVAHSFGTTEGNDKNCIIRMIHCPVYVGSDRCTQFSVRSIRKRHLLSSVTSASDVLFFPRLDFVGPCSSTSGTPSHT